MSIPALPRPLRVHPFRPFSRGGRGRVGACTPIQEEKQSGDRALGDGDRPAPRRSTTASRWREIVSASPFKDHFVPSHQVDLAALDSAREANRIPIRPELCLEQSLAGPYTRKRAPGNAPLEASLPGGDRDHGFAGTGSREDPYLVDWQKDEQANPLNWKNGFRWGLTMHLAINCLCPVFTASAYVGGIEDMLIKFYPLNQEVALLGVSLYILGQAFGPLVLAPMSEVLGRRMVFLIAFPFFILFCLGGAVAKNVPSILIFRLIAGIAGSGQLAIIGGQIQDLWRVEERVVPGGLASLTPLLGPVIGPIVAGFVAENVGYKPIFWIEFAFGAILYVTWLFFVPETYPPILLRRKALRLQQLADLAGTKERFISKYDVQRRSVRATMKNALVKPFELLFKEVMVFALSVYIALVYGILYLLFTAYPYIFQFGRGWSLGLTGLALLGIGIGMIIGFALGKFQVKFYMAARESLPPGAPVPPEVRMKLGCVGGMMIPISLFAFAWASLPQAPWILPILFSIPFGAGYVIIFTSIMLYLIDSYTLYAASALAANTVMRALFGAAFPLFGGYMYRSLGVGWAGTLLAFLSLACLPIPFLFIRYGPYLRRHSKYIPSDYAPSTPTTKVRAFRHPGSHSSERTLTGYDDGDFKRFSPGGSPVLPGNTIPDPIIAFDEPRENPYSATEQTGEVEERRGGLVMSTSMPAVSGPAAFGSFKPSGWQSTRSLQDPAMIIPEEPDLRGSPTPISARFSRTSPISPTPLRIPDESDHIPPMRQVSRPPQLHINTNPSARSSRASLALRSAVASPRLELGLSFASSPSLRETLRGTGWLLGSSLDLTVPTEDGWREYEQSLHEGNRSP